MTDPTGEMRLYLEASNPVKVGDVQSALGYSFGYGRDHRTDSDPWEYCFSNAQDVESETAFLLERDRVIHALLSLVSGEWGADLLYNARGQGSALYHWSSSEGNSHPYQTADWG